MKKLSLGETEADIIRDIENNTVFVGFMDGQMTGSVRYKLLDAEAAYFYRFGVAPAAQKYGVGTRLIRAVIDDCYAKGIKRIELHTASKMAPLIRFYYKNGFYIHSTNDDKGYIRARLIKEL